MGGFSQIWWAPSPGGTHPWWPPGRVLPGFFSLPKGFSPRTFPGTQLFFENPGAPKPREIFPPGFFSRAQAPLFKRPLSPGAKFGDQSLPAEQPQFFPGGLEVDPPFAQSQNLPLPKFKLPKIGFGNGPNWALTASPVSLDFLKGWDDRASCDTCSIPG